MKENIRIIRDQVNGERILNDIREITQFNRMQASTGYRQAAERVAARLQAEGIDCRIRPYPFDEKTWYLSHKSFLEWDCQGAWLDLETPERRRLADYQANNLSIIQKSFPCDFSREPVEIVLLDRGSDQAAYEGLDLAGKLLFIREDFKPYMGWAIKEGGGLGFISDYLREVPGVRTRADLYDARNYSSFWWKNTDFEPNTFGFVLSPRQGDELAALCLKLREEHEKDSTQPPYPTARCRMDTRLYPGAIELVESFLEGETEEEILLVAHLCHPKPCANDNASGVGSAMEMLRVLKRLLDAGDLPPLKRGIRVIFVPEFAGTYAWLADKNNRSDRVLAGLNLDMVGGRQTTGYGPLTLGAQPHAAPSFVTDMATLCYDEVKSNVPYLNPSDQVPMFNFFLGDFSAGSDHQVLTDPSIGIPTPMLGQWPDRHYHTSADTVDCLDPFILHKSASIAGAYAYSLANLDRSGAFQVLTKILERAVKKLVALTTDALDQAWETRETYEKLEHSATYFQDSCRDLQRFFSTSVYQESLEGITESFCTAIEDQKDQLFQAYLETSGQEDFNYQPESCPAQYAYVPRRLTPSPILHLEDYTTGNESLTQAYEAYTAKHKLDYTQLRTLELLIQYAMDGKRTLFEIARFVMLETTGCSVELVHDFVQLMAILGTVAL